MSKVDEKPMFVRGQVHAVLRGPAQHVRAHMRNGRMIAAHDRAGKIKAECTIHNLVTAVGDQYYAARGAGIGSPPAAITGFRLGAGSTAPAKTGAGAALVTYLSGSNQANDGGFPTAVSGVATYKVTYAAGTATTASPITEVVLVNDTIATNATTAAANTMSRALLAGIGSKGALDTLTVTWTHTLLGA
jgi:hypothetical protein